MQSLVDNRRPSGNMISLDHFAHDLRNTLTVLQCNTHMIAHYVASFSSPLQGALDERLAALSDALLQLEAQIAQIDSPPEHQAIDLVALAKRCALALQATSPAATIRVDARAAQVIGDWDGADLARALDNLVSNAVKYSPAGGMIIIQITTEQRAGKVWARLSVCDHGIGIPAEALGQIFTPYYRAANVPPMIAGSGLGLASVRQIVDAAGGTIAVRSRLNVGTCFIIRLPVGGAGRAPASEAL